MRAGSIPNSTSTNVPSRAAVSTHRMYVPVSRHLLLISLQSSSRSSRTVPWAAPTGPLTLERCVGNNSALFASGARKLATLEVQSEDAVRIFGFLTAV